MNQLITGEHRLVAGYLMESYSPRKYGNKKSLIGFDLSPHQTRTGVKPKLMYNSISRMKSRTIVSTWTRMERVSCRGVWEYWVKNNDLTTLKKINWFNDLQEVQWSSRNKTLRRFVQNHRRTAFSSDIDLNEKIVVRCILFGILSTCNASPSNEV